MLSKAQAIAEQPHFVRWLNRLKQSQIGGENPRCVKTSDPCHPRSMGNFQGKSPPSYCSGSERFPSRYRWSLLRC